MYTLVVGTYRGEVLTFPVFTSTEYFLALAIARDQSRRSAWTEVRAEDGELRIRYCDGNISSDSPAFSWRDDQLSHRRHLVSLGQLSLTGGRGPRQQPFYDDDEEDMW